MSNAIMVQKNFLMFPVNSYKLITDILEVQNLRTELNVHKCENIELLLSTESRMSNNKIN